METCVGGRVWRLRLETPPGDFGWRLRLETCLETFLGAFPETFVETLAETFPKASGGEKVLSTSVSCSTSDTRPPPVSVGRGISGQSHPSVAAERGDQAVWGSTSEPPGAVARKHHRPGQLIGAARGRRPKTPVSTARGRRESGAFSRKSRFHPHIFCFRTRLRLAGERGHRPPPPL